MLFPAVICRITASDAFSAIKSFLFSLTFTAFFVSITEVATGVYPVHAFERSIYDVHMLPNSFPLVWGKYSADGIVSSLDESELLTLDICNADANCNQEAIDLGAYYFDEVTTIAGDYAAYYNLNGILVGVELMGGMVEQSIEDPLDGISKYITNMEDNNSLGGYRVGYLPGELIVDQTGAANYNIPIQIPQGSNSVQPSISLTYDSQSGNGVLGVGWSLSGIPVITRCGANLEIDGYAKAVQMNYEDKFCLNGQRLIAVDGAYGSDGTEYRTDIESHQKVTSYGDAGYGPAYFEVEGKDGSVMTFGYVDDVDESYDSRFESNLPGYVNRSTVETWALGKVETIDGNYYKLAYEEEPPGSGGSLAFTSSNKITRIDYTGNTNTGLTPYASVEFEYEARNDDISSWLAGSKTVVHERLKYIRTYVDDIAAGYYKLDYRQSVSAGESLLTTVSKCVVTDDNCMSPTRFDWNDGTPNITSENWERLNPNGIVTAFTRTGDFNGDGKEDIWEPHDDKVIVKLSNGSGFGLQEWDAGLNGWDPAYTFTGDFDGDGKTDIVRARGSAIYMNLARYQSFENHSIDIGRGFPSSENMFTGDFNGDGRSDIAIRSGTDMHMYLSTRAYRSTSPAFEYQMWSGVTGWDDQFSINNPSKSNKWTGDFNGDGLTDIAARYEDNIYMHLSTGSSFTSEDWSVTGGLGVKEYTWTGDYNGDGLTDIASREGSSLNYFISTGKGFISLPRTASLGWGGADYTYVGEFNGDGKLDIATAVADKLHVYSFSDWGERSETFDVSNEWSASFHSGTGDFNGDGVSDIFSRKGNSNVYMKLSRGATTNLITSFTDGYRNKIYIGYANLTDSSIFTKGSYRYPSPSIQTARAVVRYKSTLDAVNSDRGSASVTKTTYTYGDERNNLTGRGNLGFGWVKSYNEKTGLETKVELSQNYPYIGMVTREYQKLIKNSVDVTLSASYKYLRTKMSDRNRPIPYLYRNDTVSRDKNNIDLGRVDIISEIDEYGNVISTNTVTSHDDEVYTSSVVSQYEDADGAEYCKNFLVKNSTVTHSSHLGVAPEVIKSHVYSGCKLENESGTSGGRAGLTKVHYYDEFGHVFKTEIIAPEPESTVKVMETRFDSRGRFVIRVINEHGHISKTDYIELYGVKLSETDANGLETLFYYDDLGRLERTVSPGGLETITTQEWCQGCTIGAIGPEGKQQKIAFSTRQQFLGNGGIKYKPDVVTYFNSLGKAVRKTTENIDGRVINIDTSYNDLGLVYASTQPYFSNDVAGRNPTFTYYDEMTSPVKVVSPDGGVSHISRNGFTTHFVTENVKPDGQTEIQERFEYRNVQGQLLEVKDNHGVSIYYEYDAQGNKERTLSPLLDEQGNIIDPKGTVTSYEYDEFGRKKGMTDPGMGQWSYDYDSFSQLKTQTDSLNQTTEMVYDKLGRMVKRIDHDGHYSEWLYNDDLVAGDTPSTMGIGKIDSVVMKTSTDVEKYRKDTVYDEVLGLPESTETTIGSDSYLISIEYDEYHRPLVSRYPESTNGNRFAIRYSYSNGVVDKVMSEDSSVTYWQADMHDASNRVIYSQLGSGANTYNLYDIMGRSSLISAANESGDIIYQAAYQFDTIGNLMQREVDRIKQDGTPAETLVETYLYDSLNRLEEVTRSNGQGLDMSYDPLGNIRHKSDVGAFSYDMAAHPHAVISAAGNVYQYDLAGNMTSSTTGQEIAWTTFNKPDYIHDKDPVTNVYKHVRWFAYGPERSRYLHGSYDFQANRNKQVYYIGGSFEKIIDSTSGVRYKHYIRAGGSVVAEHTITALGEEATKYLQRDYQGSVVAVSDEDGNVMAQLGFDPFGGRAPVADATDVGPVISDVNRGYTGHEHLDGSGLIHMNGRVYNPTIGRFLSADPFVQAPKNLQSYNRYSYVLNNPMSYTDPSGYFSIGLATLGFAASNKGQAIIGKGLSVGLRFNTLTGAAYSKPVKRFFIKHAWARQLGSSAASFYAGPLGGAAFSAYITDISGGTYGDIFRSAGLSIGMSYLMSGGQMKLGVSPAMKMSEWKYLYGGLQNRLHRELIKDLVESNTGLNIDQFNAGLFVISALNHTSYDESEYPSRIEDGTDGYDKQFTGVCTGRGCSFDLLVDSLLAWQGLPTGNSFRMSSVISKAGKYRMHSLATMEGSNLLRQGVGDPSQVDMDGVPLGVVGQGDKVRMGEWDKFSDAFLPGINNIFNPGATRIPCGSSITCHYSKGGDSTYKW